MMELFLKIKKIGRFVFAGGIAAVVNLLTFFICVEILGIGYLLSSVISFIIALGVNFSLQKYWVFENREGHTLLKQMTRFFFAAFLNIILNLGLLHILVTFFNIGSLLAQSIALVFLSIMNYFLYKQVVFFSKQRDEKFFAGTFLKKDSVAIIGTFLFIVWIALHIPAASYGTDKLALHMSYIGDEQAPVNGAFHILEDRSLLGLRNLTTVYYGPIFSVIALPAVVGDFVTHLVRGEIAGVQDYKEYILRDWGGIVFYARLMAVFWGALGLLFLFRILTTKTINPSSSRMIPWIGVFLLAGNFMYFEYASFFRHWIFIIALLLGQIYYLIKIDEGDSLNIRRYWLYEVLLTVTSFGISYVAAISQVLWIPVLARWIFGKKMKELKFFVYYLVSIIILGALVVWWHPYAFFRILGLTGVSAPLTSLGSILEPSSQSSFAYYAQIIFLNNLALLSAGILLVGFLISQALIRHAYWIGVFILPALANFAVFSLPTHHEGRYVLLTVVLLVACVAALLVHAASRVGFRGVIRVAVVTLLSFYLIFHITSIGQWLKVMNEGPSERSAITKILELQKITPQAKTLALHGYLFGYVHTKDAYVQYAKQTHKENIDLYKALIQLKTSSSPEDLNVYYQPLSTPITKDLIKNFDHIVIRYIPEVDYDPFDTNMLNLWFYKDFADRYTQLK